MRHLPRRPWQRRRAGRYVPEAPSCQFYQRCRAIPDGWCHFLENDSGQGAHGVLQIGPDGTTTLAIGELYPATGKLSSLLIAKLLNLKYAIMKSYIKQAFVLAIAGFSLMANAQQDSMATQVLSTLDMQMAQSPPGATDDWKPGKSRFLLRGYAHSGL